MGRRSYIGGSSIIRIGGKGTFWGGGWAEPIRKIRNVAKKFTASRRALAKSYIFSQIRAEKKQAAQLPNPPKLIRAEIEAAGGFAAWCQADSERREWLEEAKARAKKRAERARVALG